MNNTIKNIFGIFILIIVLSLISPLVLAAQPSTGPSVTASPSEPVEQPLSCSNPQQCKEIDEVWRTIGSNVRNSDTIWDVSKAPFVWRSFSVLYVPPTPIQPPAPGAGALVTGDFTGCRTTQGPDTESIGTLQAGSLKNGIASQTSSYENLNRRESYSPTTGTMERLQYGTLELIQMLEKTSCLLDKQYRVKLAVKDLSLPQGGITYKSKAAADGSPPITWTSLPSPQKYTLAFHLTHQTGRDADIGYFYVRNDILTNNLDATACGKSTCESSASISSLFKETRAMDANWILLKTLNKAYPLHYIAFDKYLIRELHQYVCGTYPTDPEITLFFKDCSIPDDNSLTSRYSASGGGLLRHLNGHADHFHLTIKCPSGDSQCRGASATQEEEVDEVSQHSPLSGQIT